MNNFVKVCAAFVAAAAFSMPALAQDAKTLDELLQMIESAKISETAEQREREAAFKSDQRKQADVLKTAQNTKAAEERRSDRLEQTIRDNDIMLAGLREQRDKRLGSLKELFGHLTGAAGDIRANLNQSIVSAQIPGRTEFLDELIAKMSSDTRLPSIEDIEKLWFEQQREMVESSRVVKFPATVLLASGEQTEMEVVRVGTYNLLSDGMYLEYSPESGQVSELARQPSGYAGSAEDLQSSESGFTMVGLDPTGPLGGGLLKALINTPTLVERWHFGGIVGYVITAVFAIAIMLAIWRTVVLSDMSSKVKKQLKAGSADTGNPLGRVLQVAANNPGLDPESLELKLHEAVLKERPAIESGLSLLKIIAMVAPLLGLLGTVTGMIITFQMITLFGAGDPKAMAGGISQALITTVLGLVVAIPTVLMHTLVNGKAQRILHVLEEQSAGIVAGSIEGK
ncbi:MAG: MotA/TolQ/ExbB proton channel family protein [Porticoccaceae bacterium]|jgi:biopolymer transport protein ExbB|nr:MotA/TolQ/ExbB proton channel family protein [Porticoccaceae bacterium]MBT5577488.1 MotA/TolQ/ExbB proton channel family protein [Porticoccaceae bacterium]MBT7374444.1 MotA/TolQ/ExbB proton channel family protein [Porticoccaceae bacterium]